jgi:hypothetical protein
VTPTGGANEEPDTEPDWWPEPRPDPRTPARPRVLRVLVLHARALGVPVVLRACGAVSWQKAAWLVGCQVPVLAVGSGERSGGSAERGRMLVVASDVLTAIFAVGGFFFWLAVLTG